MVPQIDAELESDAPRAERCESSADVDLLGRPFVAWIADPQDPATTEQKIGETAFTQDDHAFRLCA